MMVVINLKNGIKFGKVNMIDGQNVYVDIKGTVYKFHKDEITELNKDKYYIVKERQYNGEVEISKVINHVRSTKAYGYKLIDILCMPTLSDFHNDEMKYNNQWYYNCRKGSVIEKFIS